MNRAQRRKDQKAAKKGKTNFGAEGKAFMEMVDRGESAQALEQAQALTKKFGKNAYAFFWLGTVLWRTKRNLEAMKAFERALKLNTKHIPSLGNLGNVYFEIKEYDQAAKCFKKLLRLEPKDAQAHFNLGNALKAMGDFEEALTHYSKAHEITPRDQSYVNGKALALRALGRDEESTALFEKILKKNPNNLKVIANLAGSYRRAEKAPEAKALYEKALRLSPDDTAVMFNLANLELESGHQEEAKQLLQKLLSTESDGLDDTERLGASHLLASLAGETTDTAPPAYVKRLFDEYARDFESHVEAKLQYSVPKDLRRLWDSLDRPSEEKPLALDLGCGTGLVAEAFQGALRSIVGVDLSPQMLQQARQKELYEALYEDDVLAYLKRTDTLYGLVIAADVLIYLGDFAAVLELVSKQLRLGGYFVFSIETTDASGHELRATGRYAHGLASIKETLSAFGFKLVREQETIVRHENNKPLAGYNLICQRVV